MSARTLRPWTVTFHKSGELCRAVVWVATRAAAIESTVSAEQITAADVVSVIAGEPRR